MLNKYWIEKLERGKQIREENKELAIQVIEDLIIEYEQKIEGYVASKQIHTCTDQIQLLSFRPWDFLCGLRIGRTFQNQIRNLDSPRNEYSFQRLPGTNETLIVRIIKCCDLNFGPELLDFVFYRPDDLYSELRKNLEPTYPELDKLQKIKARVKQDFTQCVFITRGPRYLKTTSILSRAALQESLLKYLQRQESSYKEKPFAARTRRSSLQAQPKTNPCVANTRSPSESMVISSSSSPKSAAVPIQGGTRTRRSSLQVCTNLTKVKKESQVPYFKTLFANPNEQDSKGITPMMHLLYHRMRTFEMTIHLLQAGADANIRSKKGSTVFDALFRDHNYLPPSWDGFKTAKLLINGLDRWKPDERSEIKLFIFTEKDLAHIIQKILTFNFLSFSEKTQLKELIQSRFEDRNIFCASRN